VSPNSAPLISLNSSSTAGRSSSFTFITPPRPGGTDPSNQSGVNPIGPFLESLTRGVTFQAHATQPRRKKQGWRRSDRQTGPLRQRPPASGAAPRTGPPPASFGGPFGE